MKAAIAITASTESIIRTRAAFGVLLVAFLAACATAQVIPITLSSPLETLQVNSGFGKRNGRPHYGIDLQAARNTPVLSAADGRVIFKGRQRGFGRIVIVDHGRGVETYYAHLERFAEDLTVGDKLAARQQVGYVGASGNARGVHLHFEVRHHGKPIDPLTVLNDRPR